MRWSTGEVCLTLIAGLVAGMLVEAGSWVGALVIGAWLAWGMASLSMWRKPMSYRHTHVYAWGGGENGMRVEEPCHPEGSVVVYRWDRMKGLTEVEVRESPFMRRKEK